MAVKHSEILKVLKSDLKYADPLRKEIDGKIAVWKAEYNGEPYGNEVDNRSKIVSKDIKKQSEWQHPTLIDPFVSSPDIIKASPVTFEDVDAAKQNELILNTQFCRLFNRYNFMTKSVKVMDQEGTCVIMTGWEYEDKQIEVEVPIIGVDPLGNQIILGFKTEKQTVVIKNQPTAKVCRNEDIFIDPTCEDNIDNAQFFIYRYQSDMSTLKTDGRYKNLEKIDTDGNDNDYIEEDETAFKFSDDPRKKLLVHEYWGNFDMNEDGIAEPIVCTWVGDTIIRLQTNPYPDNKPPFIVVPFSSVPFSLYGESNAELISDNQKVKTAILRGFINNMALSNNGQKGIKKGALDPTNRKRFFNGENYEFNGSATEDFKDGSYNQIPSSAFDVIALQNNEIESSTGVKSFNQGLTGNALGSTVGAARGVLDATSTRRLNIVRNIAENLVKPLMRKWMSYNSEFLSDKEIIRITNNEFIEVKRDDLDGRIDIDISVSTAEDNAAKAQELSFMMQTGQQTMDFDMKIMLMSEIARLHKMPSLAQKLDEYKPQQDPMAMKKAELEIQLLQAQIVNEQAKAVENQTDVQLKRAKTQSELAKAGKVGSEADLNNMKFIQDDLGVSHARDMEKKNHDTMSKLEIEKVKNQSKGASNGM